MKLYTEEQIKSAYNMGYVDAQVNHINDAEQYTQTLIPIKLPTDDEIHKQATNYSNLYYEFRAGAEWVIEQLKNKYL